MAAHQAPPSLGFSRQEHWSGLPFPSPKPESEKGKWSRSVVSDSSRPHGCSPPGSSIHGIFQARVLEWGAVAFSKVLNLGTCIWDLIWELVLCRCNQVKMRPYRITVDPKPLKGWTHTRREETMWQQRQRLEWCISRPRKARDSPKRPRSKEEARKDHLLETSERA